MNNASLVLGGDIGDGKLQEFTEEILFFFLIDEGRVENWVLFFIV